MPVVSFRAVCAPGPTDPCQSLPLLDTKSRSGPWPTRRPGLRRGRYVVSEE